VICRWKYNKLLLDVVPTDKSIIGFSNLWYKSAVQYAKRLKLWEKTINVVSSPYFLATKLEAFKDHGKSDFLSSHDIEDIISVLDGREEIVSDVEKSDKDIKTYLSQQFKKILNNANFHDALPGHLNYGGILEERLQIVLERMEKVAECI